MIPVLYDSNETDFGTYGIGALADTTACTVTEERNGKYEMELRYPINSPMYRELRVHRIIKAKPNEVDDPQPFRIYRISTPIDGEVTVYGQHISYDLLGVGENMWETQGASPSYVLSRILAEATDDTEFEISTEFTQPHSFAVDVPKSVYAALKGSEGSVLDVWGGEFHFDGWSVEHKTARGADNGVVIEYGKNITEFTDNEDSSGAFTHIFPYAINSTAEGEEIVTLSEKVIEVNEDNLPTKTVAVRDFTVDIPEVEPGDVITEQMLRDAVEAYIASDSNLGAVIPNIEVKFEPLWRQPEYSAALERVSLCDIVTVRHSKLGIEVAQKVVETVFDSLAEKYVSVTIGKASASAVGDISMAFQRNAENAERIAHVPSKIEGSVKAATDLITGQNGGYVVINHDESRHPDEILIMDAPSVDDAINVWRWNVNGLGYSSSGYNGPYTTAITADGKVVADFIRAGTLDANLIRAGVLSSNDGKNYWDLVAGTAHFEGYETVIRSLSDQATVLSDSLESARAEIESLKGSVATLRVDTDRIVARVDTEMSGGINFVRNSTGLNGTAEWLTVLSVTTDENTDIQNNTVGNAAFVLSGGIMQQNITNLVPGEYTLSFRAKKVGSGHTLYVNVIYDSDEQDTVASFVDASSWNDYSYTFTVNSGTLGIGINGLPGSSNERLYIADIMLAQGNVPHAWTPAPDEIYTTQVSVDRRGLEVRNAASQQTTRITNEEFAGYYGEEKIFTLNKDETQMQKTVIGADLTVGKLRIQPLPNPSDGADIILLD